MANEPMRDFDDLDTGSTEAPLPLDDLGEELFTPMGQVDSLGRFARGLGARRVKIAIFAGGALLLTLALIAALAG